jgi:hypothetical protein
MKISTAQRSCDKIESLFEKHGSPRHIIADYHNMMPDYSDFQRYFFYHLRDLFQRNPELFANRFVTSFFFIVEAKFVPGILQKNTRIKTCRGLFTSFQVDQGDPQGHPAIEFDRNRFFGTVAETMSLVIGHMCCRPMIPISDDVDQKVDSIYRDGSKLPRASGTIDHCLTRGGALMLTSSIVMLVKETLPNQSDGMYHVWFVRLAYLSLELLVLS